MKFRLLVVVLLAVCFLLSGCSNSTPKLGKDRESDVSQRVTTPTTEFSGSNSENEGNSIFLETLEENNLPVELYYETPFFTGENEGFSAANKRYSLYLEQATTYFVTVETANGTISIGVKYKDRDQYAIEKEEFAQSKETEWKLEPGGYYIVISADFFSGTFRITAV